MSLPAAPPVLGCTLTPWEIADARAADLEALADLWVEAWRATMPDIDFDARRGWFLENFTTRTASGTRALVLRADGGLLGFVMIDPRTGYLDQIAVAPACRGSQAAARLIGAAKAASPGGIDLDVNVENTRALAFYAKHGFVVTGEAINPRSGRPVHKMAWRPR